MPEFYMTFDRKYFSRNGGGAVGTCLPTTRLRLHDYNMCIVTWESVDIYIYWVSFLLRQHGCDSISASRYYHNATTETMSILLCNKTTFCGTQYLSHCRAECKGCSSEKPHPPCGRQSFFSGEGGGIQTAQIRGVYWSDVPGNPGWMMSMRFPFSRVTVTARIGNFKWWISMCMAANFKFVYKFWFYNNRSLISIRAFR